MEPWYTKTPKISTYDPKGGGIHDNVLLAERLSPLTNFFLNVFYNSMEKNNLIYALPSTILRPIPLISYLYACNTNKSVIVFTQNGRTYSKEDPSVFHNRNYHLLNMKDTGIYLFDKVPIGFMKDGSVEAKVYLPRAKRGLKQIYIQNQKKNFLEKNGPKILLQCDENNNRISSVIEKITLDEGELYNLNVNIKIGLVIFENVDRFLYSSYSSQIFLKWISTLLEKNVRVLIHFSNPLSKYIQVIKEHTDSYVLQFGPSLLRYNKELKKASLTYFESIHHDEKRFLNKYNIDRPFFYTGITDVELLSPPLPSGNIDEYYRGAMSLRGKINEEELVNQKAYYSLINLLFQLHNMSINPSKYKRPFYDPDIGYRTYTIPHMIEKLKEHLSDENTHNKLYLEYLLSEIYCFYSELTECKRYGENDSYSRVAKDYKILQLLNESINQEKDATNIVIATYSPIERSILKNETKKLVFDNNFYIEHIDALTKKSFDRTKTTLILPGPIRLKYFSELLRPYKKIIIISYEGMNYKRAKEQISLINDFSQEREDRAMTYLDEIYSDLGLQKDGLFKDYYDRKSKPKEKEAGEFSLERVKTETEDDDPLLLRIKRLLRIQSSKVSEEILREEEDAARIEKKITELEKEEEKAKIDEANEFYKVSLEEIDGEKIIERNLPVNKSYLYLKDIDGDVKEGYPSDIAVDNYIVLIGNDERKTFLDTIIEIFGLEDSINRHLLTIWRDKLRDFIDKQGMNARQAHRLFKQNGGSIGYQEFANWIKGSVFAPQNSEDLLILGRMIGDNDLIENYELVNQEAEDLRKIHKSTGRKVRKIIKEILRGELNQSELSFEEYVLYGQIQNNIYRIVYIEKIDGKEVK